MPIDRESDEARAKRDAESAHAFFNRLITKGHSRAEAGQLTGAWIMARMVNRELPVEDEETPEWLRGSSPP